MSISPTTDSFMLPLSADVAKDQDRLWRLAVEAAVNALSDFGGARERLAANRTYYVRSDGNDANTGLVDNAGGAKLTLQSAYNAARLLDFNNFTVTIQSRKATDTAGISISNPWTGGGSLIILGDETTPANAVVASTTGNVFSVSTPCPGTISVRGFKMSTNVAGAGCLSCTVSGTFLQFQNVDFAASPGSNHIVCNNGGRVQATGNYTISGGAARHIFDTAGFVIIPTRTVTISGTPAFSTAFCDAIGSGGFVNLAGNTFSGSATGKRYQATLNSSISVNGAATTYLPGDVTGTTATGAQYA